MSGANVVKNTNLQQNVALNNNKKLPSKTNQSEDFKNIRRCLRKGSRICYTDMENITVLKKIPDREMSKISFLGSVEDDIYEKVDSYRSGESLFKTFTFEQTRDIDDPETVKCIEFWRSVMQKNLAPIKCTLLACDKKCVEKKERSSASSEKKAEFKKSQEKTEEVELELNATKIWSEALKEIRKKKLDQLKLYVRERCEYCRDPFTKQLKDELGMESKEDEAAQIASLNDWKPNEEQTDLGNDSRKRSLKNRLSGKIKRISATQTTETRVKEDEEIPQKESSVILSKTIVTIPGSLKKMSSGAKIPSGTKVLSSSKLSSIVEESIKRPPSVLKHVLNTSQQALTSGSKKVSLHVASMEVQAPGVKCACKSDTCICPHRNATRNSRTSFVEIARQNMLQEDRSIDKFFPADEDTCICSTVAPYPWLHAICSTETCIGKSSKVEIQESSSDFDMSRIFGKDANSTCICRNKFEVICPRDECQNKYSQGSLVEGFSLQEGERKVDPCICNTSVKDVPCANTICPTKHPRGPDTKCICDKNLPWSQAKCQSWSCSHQFKKLQRRRLDEEEKSTFRRHPPIKEIASTCLCGKPHPWTRVTCSSEQCASKPKIEPILKSTEKKRSSTQALNKAESSSIEMVSKKDKNSRERFTSPSKEKLIGKEKNKVSAQIAHKLDKCICSTAPPWKTVSCPSATCKTKEKLTEETELCAVISTSRVNTPVDNHCICQDKTMETTCRSFKCKDRGISFEYAPPCICPKDQDESKHEHFQCLSDTCKMKRIDKTCICRKQPDAPCDTLTCEIKPEASKTLKYVQKPLKYDSKCICKVRGLPTTQEVSCTVPECPFRKKHWKFIKKKIPKLFVATPKQDLESSDPITKCICNTTDMSVAVKCQNSSCKKKSSSDNYDSNSPSFGDDDEDSPDPEICICNKLEKTDSTEEVICKHVQCRRTSVSEGVVMNDKCVCATLETPCDEPSCPTLIEININRCRDDSAKKGRPYCYICGHYDCASTKKQAVSVRVCQEQYNGTKNAEI